MMASFTRPDLMQGVFQQHASQLFSRISTIVRCTLMDVRHKSYRKPESANKATLSVCYRLELVHSDDGAQEAQILYVKAYRSGNSASVWANMQRNGAGSSIQSAVHLSELDMIIWRFPHDPVLLHLPEVLISERVVHHFPFESLPVGARQRSDVLSVNCEVVNYRPETRCTTRFRVKWGHPDAPQSMTLFGKTFADESGREVYRRMQDLWQRGADNGMLVPQPLGYAEPIKTIWQAQVEGVPLRQIITYGNFRDYIQAVTKGLTVLHASDTTGYVTVTMDDHLREAEKKLSKLGHAVPRYHKAGEWLRGHLRAMAADLEPTSSYLIHGDFHIGQLLAQGDKVAFFDFDEFARGDPQQDLANFIVDLHFRGFDPELVQQMSLCLIASYEQQQRTAVPRARLYWHALVQFINKAYRGCVQQPSESEEHLRNVWRYMRNWQSWLPSGRQLESIR